MSGYGGGRRDYLGYLLAVVSVVVGVYVSWFYYEKSLQSRRPIFVFDYIPSTVYDAKREVRVPLRVTRENGDPLQKSVHVATHSFWNAGNLPITASDVLTPVRVSLNDTEAELLAVSVVKQSRNVVGCTVQSIKGNSFEIGFRILEQDDGCRVQAFYAGAQAPKYNVSGEVIGVKRIEASGETVFDYIEKRKSKSELVEQILSRAPRFILWTAISALAWLYMRDKPASKVRSRATLGFIALVLVAVIGVERVRFWLDDMNQVPSVNTANWLSTSP